MEKLDQKLGEGISDLCMHKQLVAMSEVDVFDRIESIEKEVEELKASVRDRDVEMKGRLSKAKFDEEDFKQAKKSLFQW